MNLAELQKKVFHEYMGIRAFKEMSNMEAVTNDIGREPGGCLVFPFFSFGIWLAKRYSKEAAKKRNYKVFEPEAEELLKQNELKILICNFLKEKGSKEILTEEKFVYAVTEVLFRVDVRKKFVIPIEPVLFGFVAVKIFETGIQEFCDKNNQ